MDTLKDIIGDIRTFIYGGITTLPLTIAGTLSIIGLFTSNYAMLFFLIGYLIGVPLVASILNFGIGSIVASTSYNPFRVKTSDICKVVIPFATSIKNSSSSTDETIIFSQWMAMISFFLGYIIKNSLQLYEREPIDGSDKETDELKEKVSNRKTQAIISIFSIIIFGLIVIVSRFYSGCDSILGMILTLLLFGGGGYFWYTLLSKVGQDRLSDLFGIANRLLSPTALKNGPVACIPVSV